MKTTRLVGLFALAALLPLAGLAKTPKTKTYTIAAYFFEGDKPKQELVDQAAREVGAKMNGMVQTGEPDEADHAVEILFKKGTYKIYVDALPIAPKLAAIDRQAMEANDRFAADMAREPHLNHVSEPVRVK